ncbi:proline racemase family protein [Embleya sp. NPDC008237]|uniref:proline racemase family protein n=1 Tax=Embleya sp. NPDC008237 TaxID=3363978 RepID=UPI0036EF4DD6
MTIRRSAVVTTFSSSFPERPRGTHATRWPSIPVGSTVLPAHRHVGTHGATARPRRTAVGRDFPNESFIGTTFTGRLVEETTVAARPAVIPTVTGRAWVTGTAQYLLDPTDPFPGGFLL